jgi:23S rRNA pseudouridine1911/1915/1917 synthase
MPEPLERAPLEKDAFRVEPAEAGERLDAFLARRAAHLSRSRHKALIKDGNVTVSGAPSRDPNRRLEPGELVEISVPPPEPADPEPESIPLDVVYEDADLIVIDKPPGLVVHPGAGNWNGTLVNALLAHCGDSLSGVGGVKRPGIVHRLDKDTSGLLVVAKNDEAHQNLSAQFADHGREGPLVREYDALVWGVPDPHIGTVDAPLDPATIRTQKQAVSRSGRTSRNHHIMRFARTLWHDSLDCPLSTGRRAAPHQIRVHPAYIGHPALGDLVYGAGY